ncbi:MAG TPA: hypothetical protein VMU73_04295 [Gaiellaceae bacterium]|nr:hypothetical protein [Gaiellaceae bacterium]
MTLDEKYTLRDTILTMQQFEITDTDTGEPRDPIPSLRPIINAAKAAGCDGDQIFRLCWESVTKESWSDLPPAPFIVRL